MNNFRKKSLTTAAVIAPLLMAAGCASDQQNLAQFETENGLIQQDFVDQTASTATAIANMDGYMSELSDDQPMLDAVANETEEIVAPVAEAVVADNENQITHGSMTDETLLLSEILGVGQNHIEALEQQPNQQKSKVVLPPPQQLVFQFGFNKHALSDNDRTTLQAHSDYLLQHPNYILVISGHTDNRGPEIYNQRLSEQRAQNIADQLIAAGVPESQLRVSGMAGNIPRVSPDNWQENRRVELVYQDSMLAKNQ